MLREAVIALALAGALVALAPGVPALPGPACGAVSSAEVAVQNDARSGADAPDARAAALAIPSDGYYWGWLSLAHSDTADLSDWYSFDVPPATESLMAHVTANYTLVYVQTFYLTLHPPDGGAPITTTSLDDGLALADPAPGRYDIRISASPVVTVEGCSASPVGAPDAPDAELFQNHGLYLGCNPVCVDGTAT